MLLQESEQPKIAQDACESRGAVGPCAITLLCWKEAGDAELNAAKIVAFAGLESSLVKLDEHIMTQAQSLEDLMPVAASVVVSADTLAWMVGSKGGEGWLQSLFKAAANCFVFGFHPSEQHSQLIHQLTSGQISAVQALTDESAKFEVEATARELCRQFAGLSFGAADGKFDRLFTSAKKSTDCKPLIRIGQKLFFVSVKQDKCELFLSASAQAANLDEVIPKADSIVKSFSRLAPLLMFLYHAGGKGCWQNDEPKACLILDDPLLKKQYGFLHYETLLELMERENFSTSIAFIPWNYRRSDENIVNLFKQFPNRYGVCVHGCDHTGGEFGATELDLLRERAGTGLERMKKHQQLTGLGFDEVMVFPQGCFSSVALEALKACGFLAAINSTPYPVDRNSPLRLRDLLGVAVNQFSGFALFGRRYPKSLDEMAFDLFLGKPAFLVEHHGYFRDGYAPLAETVQRLRAMEPRVEWSNPSDICSRASLKRQTANGSVEVRFFTDRFLFENKSRETQQYSLIRAHPPAETLPTAMVNGRAVSGERCGENLRITIELKAGESAKVVLERQDQNCSSKPAKRTPSRRLSVFVRRHLSEFRDNHVDKNRFLSRAALQLRNRLVKRK
jgi:hypothetical protein